MATLTARLDDDAITKLRSDMDALNGGSFDVKLIKNHLGELKDSCGLCDSLISKIDRLVKTLSSYDQQKNGLKRVRQMLEEVIQESMIYGA